MPIVLWSSSSSLTDGDPNLAVRGTGFAVPSGVEAVFQYNGMIFNDRSVIDKIRITSIDGLDDADIRDSREENPASEGETAYDAYHSGRTIIFNGRIEAYSLYKLRDMQEGLRTAFVDLTEKPLYFLTGNSDSDHYINCRKFSKIQWSETQQHLNHFYRDFQLTLRASNPRFFRYKKKTYTIVPTNDSNSRKITNFGNYTSEPVIRLYGDMSNIEIYNESRLHNGQQELFKLKGTVQIEAGDFFEVNVAKRTIVNSAGVNKISCFDISSDWLKLNPGDNYIFIPGGKCTPNDLNARVEIIMNDTWI